MAFMLDLGCTALATDVLIGGEQGAGFSLRVTLHHAGEGDLVDPGVHLGWGSRADPRLEPMETKPGRSRLHLGSNDHWSRNSPGGRLTS